MTKVFIGGSRHVSRLSARMKERLDAILSKGFPIVIGDANGADRAVQKYLFGRRYGNVEVFCSGGHCRNNIGAWTVRNVPAQSRQGTAEFYSVKDRVMAEEATVGLMIWDGESVGTLMNVLRLLNLDKKVVIYAVPQGGFVELHNALEWDSFIKRCALDLRRKVEQRASLETPTRSISPAQASFFDRDHRLHAGK
jgi:hypothetical protein